MYIHTMHINTTPISWVTHVCTCIGMHTPHTPNHMPTCNHSCTTSYTHTLTCHNYTVHAALPTCNIFGNNLVQATAASTKVNGLYTKIANAASCAGNVTRWNMCYYSANSDARVTSYFAVYRPTNGSNYRRIGPAATYDATRNTTVAYVCDHIPIPQSEQYVVLPQDVLAVCLRSLRYQAMVASNVTGASVLKATPRCGSTSAMTDTLDVTGFNTIASTTLHVSIGM